MTYKETLQRMFDIVSKHLLSQGEKCALPDMCMYRLNSGNKTLKCAVGALISDEYYDRELEEKPVGDPLVLTAVMRSNPWMYPYRSALDSELRILQRIHDKETESRWEPELRAFADYRGLAWNN